MGLFSKIYFSDDTQETEIKYKGDKNDMSYEQHKIEREHGTNKHEHTWSETTIASHKEGWHGKDYPTNNNK